MRSKLNSLPAHSVHRETWFQRCWLTLQRRELLRLERLRTTLGRRPPGPAHLETGKRGEFEALFFLRAQRYVVVERRWRSPELNGDLDLIAWEGATLCFIEVKTRTARDHTPAGAAIDEAKREMIRSMGRAYLRTLPREHRNQVTARCDVVSVYLLPSGVECELSRGAFEWR